MRLAGNPLPALLPVLHLHVTPTRSGFWLGGDRPTYTQRADLHDFSMISAMEHLDCWVIN